MDTFLAKTICIFIFIIVTTTGCLIPYLIGIYGKKHESQNENKIKNILSNLNCFGSGFIFSIIMFHLLPETIFVAIEHDNMKIFNSYDKEIKILYIFFFVFIGFCMQLALEYVLPTDRHICCVLHENENVIPNENYINKLVKTNNNSHNLEMHNVIINEAQYLHACENHNITKKNSWEFLQVLTMQSFFLTLSLAIHSFIEGMVVGTSDQVNYVFINSFCILSHKWIAGITVSISLNQNNLSNSLKIILLMIFIISSPLGIILGYVVQAAGEKITCIINAISIGTLLFIGCEILLNEINEKFSRKVRFTKWISFCCSCIIAFSIICLMAHISPHTH
ncbi:Zn2+ or Fe2+ permease, putative [Plasmodium gallinaceum]|uniref:Zn2+ or Fe2+ permease, putative n=1 Tax=Plasmodium gallinaceum TaxID=5849 RepID=A0A1J1GMJ8_PLAGA|nr:Zn2+ or Fe2+ permease, putative [Plasmodium gallinaceum]CRG93672.1 Zn2+ or Fe2+ permease, putative [Plasmodium gallinaceum]